MLIQLGCIEKKIGTTKPLGTQITGHEVQLGTINMGCGNPKDTQIKQNMYFTKNKTQIKQNTYFFKKKNNFHSI